MIMNRKKKETLLDYNAAYSNYIDLLSTEEVIGVDDDR